MVSIKFLAKITTETDKSEISRISDCHNSWKKKCKLLGSLSDTKEAIDSLETLENIFNNKHVSEIIRPRIFKAYVESIFLYNSELWTFTETLEDRIGSFER